MSICRSRGLSQHTHREEPCWSQTGGPPRAALPHHEPSRGAQDRARELACTSDVRIVGGAGTPVVLGRGERLWDDLRMLEDEYTVTSEVAESGVIHVTCAR